MWIGIITFGLMIVTAAIAVMNRRGDHRIPIKWHFTLARVAILFALLHAPLGLTVYLT